MPFDLLSDLGAGVARVRYMGIGTTGIRNLINDSALAYDAIRSAVQPGERGPPAIEVPNPAGFGSSYRDLESGQFISEEEYQRRRQSAGRYRSTWLCEEATTTDRRQGRRTATDYTLEVSLVTERPHEKERMATVWGKAFDRIHEFIGGFEKCQKVERENSEAISPEEGDIGEKAFITIKGNTYDLFDTTVNQYGNRVLEEVNSSL